MPIKPENAARYPSNWPAISRDAKERAGWKCQHAGCTAGQYSVGRWICWGGGPHEWRPVEGNRPETTEQDREFFMAGEGRGADGERWTWKAARDFIGRWSWDADAHPLVIVLTVAHLDHTPENVDPSNLRAFCQRHHLAYDRDHHAANAQATRRAKAGTLELF